MNKTRLLDSYVWREIDMERGRWEFPGVMKLNRPYFFFPSHQLSPCRVFSKDKGVEETEILQKFCICVC